MSVGIFCREVYLKIPFEGKLTLIMCFLNEIYLNIWDQEFLPVIPIVALSKISYFMMNTNVFLQ